MKLSEIAATKRTGESMFIGGKPKAGKTELAGTLAEDFNVLWFDLENGLQTLVKTPRISADAKARIEVVQVVDTKVNPIAIDTMLRVLTGAPVKICKAHGAVNCLECSRNKAEFQEICLGKLDRTWVVVIDSLTQLSDSAYAHVAGSSLDTKLEWQQYDKWNQRIAMCLSFIQQAPYHTVVIGHVQGIEGDDGKEQLIPIGGTKAFSQKVAKYFGHVLYCETRAGQHKVGSHAAYNVNVLLGNRAGIQFTDKTKLSEFFK